MVIHACTAGVTVSSVCVVAVVMVVAARLWRWLGVQRPLPLHSPGELRVAEPPAALALRAVGGHVHLVGEGGVPRRVLDGVQYRRGGREGASLRVVGVQEMGCQRLLAGDAGKTADLDVAESALRSQAHIKGNMHVATKTAADRIGRSCNHRGTHP